MKVKGLCSISLNLAVGTLPFASYHLFLAVHLKTIFNAWLNQHHFLLWIMNIVDSRISVQLPKIKIFVASYLYNQGTLMLELVFII